MVSVSTWATTTTRLCSVPANALGSASDSKSALAEAVMLIIGRSYASEMYAITRLKAALNAWYWGVHFRRRGTLYSKRFYDLKHGGLKKALIAAIAWRDRNVARVKVLTYLEFHQQKRSNNTSGVPGVHFLKPPGQPQGIWRARIKLTNGKKIHKTFSVRKFGNRAAFERAVVARSALLQLVQNRPYLKHESAKKIAARLRRRGLRSQPQ